MLALAVRGIFLVGILSWYSTSVWKMIDGYFKDQFRTYLDEEYRKNPHMRSDLQSARTASDKKAPDVVDAREEADTAQLRRIVEACQADTCPIDGAESSSPDTSLNVENFRGDDAGESVETAEKEASGGGGSENGAEGATDKTPRLKSEESGSESGKNDGVRETPGQESAESSAGEIRDESETKAFASEETRAAEIGTKGRRVSRRDKFAEDRRRRGKKQKVRTITLTAQDFASVRDDASDPDFWEFEEDAEEREPREGILVADLPFKPKLEIGSLERVTADEYCPLSLEDEKSCRETAEWP